MGDVVIGQRRHICDIHMTPILGEVLHFPFCRPYLRQNPLRVLQEDPAVFCEGHIASLLLEQGKAQLLLQRVDGTTEAGLGDIQLFAPDLRFFENRSIDSVSWRPPVWLGKFLPVQ